MPLSNVAFIRSSCRSARSTSLRYYVLLHVYGKIEATHVLRFVSSGLPSLTLNNTKNSTHSQDAGLKYLPPHSASASISLGPPTHHPSPRPPALRLPIHPSIHPLVPAGKHDRRALPLRLLLGSSSGLPSRFRTPRFERPIREVRGHVVQAFARRQRGAADGVGAEGVVGPPDELG
jgi:hypothetical protein